MAAFLDLIVGEIGHARNYVSGNEHSPPVQASIFQPIQRKNRFIVLTGVKKSQSGKSS